MAGRMPWCMDPAPPGHKRHAAIRRELAEPLAYVNWAFRIQAGKQRHQPTANGWIGRRIRRAAIKIRQLKLVSVNRYIPGFRQMFERPNVIEVPMGEDKCGRASICAEALSGSGSNAAGHAWN